MVTHLLKENLTLTNRATMVGDGCKKQLVHHCFQGENILPDGQHCFPAFVGGDIGFVGLGLSDQGTEPKGVEAAHGCQPATRASQIDTRCARIPAGGNVEITRVGHEPFAAKTSCREVPCHHRQLVPRRLQRLRACQGMAWGGIEVEVKL